MNDPHQSQAISNLGVLALSLLFGFLSWAQDHAMMRHGLAAGAVWTGGVFTMRMLNSWGIGTPLAARQFNGWFSFLIATILIATWIAQRWSEHVVARRGGA